MKRVSDTPLTAASPPATPADPGYSQWLKRQLQQAQADLDDPNREEIEHDEVFADLDNLITKHEKR
jgi:hypothetical protein